MLPNQPNRYRLKFILERDSPKIAPSLADDYRYGCGEWQTMSARIERQAFVTNLAVRLFPFVFCNFINFVGIDFNFFQMSITLRSSQLCGFSTENPSLGFSFRFLSHDSLLRLPARIVRPIG